MPKRPITQADIAEMDEAELAALAAKAPHGFSPVIHDSGQFSFIADSQLGRMSPSARATLRIIGRMN